MTKLTFDIDFNKDPEEILREIQERAKEEVAKRESKEKTKIYLSNLHKRVNEDLGTKYASINDLIRALSAHANPKSRSKTQAISPTGRRITISMNKEIFDEIKDLLAQPNPNKAAIARQTGVSVVQVRKVATGGYDNKFEGESSLDQPSISPSPKPSSDSASLQEKPQSLGLDLPPVSSSPKINQQSESPVEPLPVAEIASPEPVDLPEESTPPALLNQEGDAPASIDPPTPPPLDLPPVSDAPPPVPSLDLPPIPEAPPTAPEPPQPEPVAEGPLLPPPSLGEEEADIPAPIAPPPAPSLDLPPLPEAPPPAPEPPQPEPVAEEPLLPPPSLGEEEADIPTPIAPPPAPSLDLPPLPETPPPAPEPPQPEPVLDSPTPPAPSPELPPAPPSPSLDAAPPSPPSPPEASPSAPSPAPGTPPKPSLSMVKKPLGAGGKPGGTKFSLKSGKKKTTGLKITRPPMRPPSA